ncbi:hypothetical protein N8I74_19290 [Chitiniphilus purpureus]|uniref:Lysozyme inhibitor n=1 Tax=Chitiniphilus purpureus TaxID=2981137 RepID=A0ABY6DM33_9NEIS|nr:hypothetical protein [Chitiniphilus sp. CD1]UXY15427.1 hypothetical protein N8I74_19290 [Chitiniphilus sp. CD1]
MLRPSCIVAALLTSTTVLANGMSCYESSLKKQVFCVDQNEVTASGNLRAGQLYLVQGDAREKSAFSLLTDCSTKKSALLDQSGKNVTAGQQPSPVATALAERLCQANKPRHDPSLPML